MSAINPFAWFDILATLHHVRTVLSTVAEEEFHLLSYFACLLSLYKGWPIADWGYDYAATKYGAPYSPAIDETLNQLVAGAFINQNGLWYHLTERGEEEYKDLLNLTGYSDRDILYEAIGAMQQIYPIGLTRKAISQDPLMRSAAISASKHLLLGEESLPSLNDNFEVIKEILSGSPDDLLVPATIWVEYFSQQRC